MKSLKAAQTDKAVRPRFRNGSEVFSTPSSSPKTPASWPPRPDSTRLGPTCVADHDVSFFIQTPTEPLKHHVMTPVVMSFVASWNVFMALEHDGDVDFDFRQAGSYILKQRDVYYEIEGRIF